MYNELFYLNKKCLVLKMFSFFAFDESTNFKICDIVMALPAKWRLQC